MINSILCHLAIICSTNRYFLLRNFSLLLSWEIQIIQCEVWTHRKSCNFRFALIYHLSKQVPVRKVRSPLSREDPSNVRVRLVECSEVLTFSHQGCRPAPLQVSLHTLRVPPGRQTVHWTSQCQEAEIFSSAGRKFEENPTSLLLQYCGVPEL